MLVDEPVGAGRRDDGQEPLDVLVAGERVLEVADVAIERRTVIGQRAGADPLTTRRRRRRLAVGNRTTGVVALAGGGLLERVESGVGAGERLPVSTRGHHRPGGHVERPQVEAADPLVEVRDPARLAHLAVVDDVDPDLDLAAHDVGDGLPQAFGVRRLVDLLPRLLGAQERQQLGRPDQAADMGRHDPVHRSPSPTLLSGNEPGLAGRPPCKGIKPTAPT